MTDTVQQNKVTLALCCDHFLTDAQGKASLIGLFQAVNFVAVPEVLTRFFVVFNLSNVTGSKARIFIERPDKSVFTLADLDYAGKDDLTFVNLSVEVRNFEFTSFGDYRIVCVLGGEEVGEFRFPVRQIGNNV